jgi:hypothetical protein
MTRSRIGIFLAQGFLGLSLLLSPLACNQQSEETQEEGAKQGAEEQTEEEAAQE